jgi:hypothetical protein
MLAPDEITDAFHAVCEHHLDEFATHEAVAALAPHLPQRLVGEALEITLRRRYGLAADDALAALAPRLDEEQLELAFNAVTKSWEWMTRGKILGALAPRMSESMLADAFDRGLKYAGSITTGYAWFAALAPHLSDEFARHALASAMRDPAGHTALLAALAPRLPAALTADVLRAATTIGARPERSRLLVSLAGAIAPGQLAEALVVVERVPDPVARADALVAITIKSDRLDVVTLHRLFSDTILAAAVRGETVLSDVLVTLSPVVQRFSR